MSRKVLTCIAILAALFSSHAQGDGLIYVATQDTDDLQELYSVNVSGSGGSITAATPVKISAPQPVGGGVVFGIPNFGNSDQVLYGANQDDTNKMDLYIVNLAAPGISIKINADLTADQEIGDDIAVSPDGSWIAGQSGLSSAVQRGLESCWAALAMLRTYSRNRESLESLKVS